MAYIGLEVEKLTDLNDQYAQILADYFAPLIPEDYVLRTQHEQGQVIVHRKGFQANIKITDENLKFTSTNSSVLDNMLFTLCSRIFEYKKQLTQHKLEINGLKG